MIIRYAESLAIIKASCCPVRFNVRCQVSARSSCAAVAVDVHVPMRLDRSSSCAVSLRKEGCLTACSSASACV